MNYIYLIFLYVNELKFNKKVRKLNLINVNYLIYTMTTVFVMVR